MHGRSGLSSPRWAQAPQPGSPYSGSVAPSVIRFSVSARCEMPRCTGRASARFVRGRVPTSIPIFPSNFKYAWRGRRRGGRVDEEDRRGSGSVRRSEQRIHLGKPVHDRDLLWASSLALATAPALVRVLLRRETQAVCALRPSEVPVDRGLVVQLKVPGYIHTVRTRQTVFALRTRNKACRRHPDVSRTTQRHARFRVDATGATCYGPIRTSGLPYACNRLKIYVALPA